MTFFRSALNDINIIPVEDKMQIGVVQRLIYEYGTDVDLQTVLRLETRKGEQIAFLDAFREDVREMSVDTLLHIIEDPKTSTECFRIASSEIQYRPRRTAIQDALLHRAIHGIASEASLVHKLPEYNASEKLIIEIEETREENDIITLLTALSPEDDRLRSFDKQLVASALGRTLLKWKKPLRPYIIDRRFSKQETMIALSNFKILASKCISKVVSLLLQNINCNLFDLVQNSTVKDYIALAKVEHVCKNDAELMAWIEARKIVLRISHPDISALIQLITTDQNDPACLEQ